MIDLEPDTPKRKAAGNEKRTLLLFAAVGGGIVIVGLVVVLILSLTTGVPGNTPNTPGGPDDSKPPLAQKCPPPTKKPPQGDVPEDSGGQRTVDTESGISYKAYGSPWRNWDQGDWNQGELHIKYIAGQYFVTETYSEGDYLASILSGHVPAAVNDGTDLDLKCVSQQVVADVRKSYYPQPNKFKSLRDEAATLGGRPAWVREFEVRFHQDGLTATNERVGVALIDVGRKDAAVLYVSIPGTHKQYDKVVNEVLDSVRPTHK
ncbi:MAG TPA: hypothetical protein VE172_14275 [Stackebrandtia sp.]|uniref:hypothetical protein n=1 Tax=Stackebrandtia sp. TaxID=2023065 RepID=UPI002D3CCDA4|nr:hypothetical protein [Stackebrandtia sp.]HZE39969.1 hypothetical protein [Stackebrandtia sp.]